MRVGKILDFLKERDIVNLMVGSESSRLKTTPAVVIFPSAFHEPIIIEGDEAMPFLVLLIHLYQMKVDDKNLPHIFKDLKIHIDLKNMKPTLLKSVPFFVKNNFFDEGVLNEATKKARQI